jgi:hypothetical protein
MCTFFVGLCAAPDPVTQLQSRTYIILRTHSITHVFCTRDSSGCHNLKVPRGMLCPPRIYPGILLVVCHIDSICDRGRLRAESFRDLEEELHTAAASLSLFGEI